MTGFCARFRMRFVTDLSGSEDLACAPIVSYSTFHAADVLQWRQSPASAASRYPAFPDGTDLMVILRAFTVDFPAKQAH
jgi:hypothetical protein